MSRVRTISKRVGLAVRVRSLWVASWLVSGLAASALLASGCSEVEKCKESVDLGCINTAPLPDKDRPCLYDLVLRGNLCVRPGSDEDKCGLCAEGALCVPERNDCLNVCQPPPVLPGSVAAPEPIFCEATDNDDNPNTNPMLSFADVCKSRCRLRNRGYQQFCAGYQPPAGSCDGPDVQAACLAECPLLPTGGNDVACLTKSCNDARFSRCDTGLKCPNGVAPKCNDLACTNDCSFESGGAGDGYCDDGDIYSAASALCAWGTDCADCGARPVTKPALGLLGDVCSFSNNCEGGTARPSDATAWCIEQRTVAGSKRCMPDCSRDQDCPDGFTCFELSARDPVTMQDVPIKEGDLTGKACVPQMCL